MGALALKSLDEAQRVARLIAEGRISGAGRAQALHDLKAFDSQQRNLANIAADQKSYNPVDGMSTGEKLRAGIGSGLTSVTRIFDKDARDEAEKLDAPLMETGAGRTGQFIGELAPALLAGGGAGAGVRALLPKAAGALGRAGTGAAAFAAEGAAGAGATGHDMAEGALFGVGGGTVASAGGALLKKAVRGLNKSKDAEVLLRRGADLTPGQLNPGSFVSRLERASSQQPLGGSGVIKAQEKGLSPVLPNTLADMTQQPRIAGETLPNAAKRTMDKLDRQYQPIKGMEMDKGARKVLRAGREDIADDARRARGRGERTEDLAQTDLRIAAAEARENAQEAARKVNEASGLETPPENLNQMIVKAQRLESRANILEHQADNIDARDIPQAGRDAARGVIDDSLPQGLRDLNLTLNASLAKNGLAKDAPARSLVDRLGKNILKSKDVDTVQDAISQLRTAKHALSYGKQPDATARATARVYGDALKWFMKTRDSLVNDRGVLRSVRRGDRMYARTVPMIETIAKTGDDPLGVVTGKQWEDSIKRSMSKRQFAAGRGGPEREVSKALRAVQEHQTGGVVERVSKVREILNMATLPMAALARSKSGRLAARGDTELQRRAARFARSKNGRFLRKSLKLYSTVTPGQVPAHDDEE